MAMDAERVGRAAIGAGILLFLAAAVVGFCSGHAGASDPTLTIAPGPSSGSFSSGETLALTVGPNSVFAPQSRIVILECAAPGGQLPVDDSTCDGNTVQGDSILVGSDGSFSEPAYTMYALPSTTLDEQANHLPICGATSECVLYVGQNQNDFKAPKIFSIPFTVIGSASGGGAGSTCSTTPAAGGAAGGTNGGSGGATTAVTAPTAATSSSVGSSVPDASVSLANGSLAFTGPPVALPLLLATGGAMVAVGSMGRILSRVARR
jgi:hypothetical protein